MKLPKNCYRRGGTIYYQKHVPDALRSIVGKSTIKVTLKSNGSDELAIIKERYEINEQVCAYLDSLKGKECANLILAAKGLLKSVGLKEGELQPELGIENEEYYLDYERDKILNGPLAELYEYKSNRAEYSGLSMPESLEVQELAFKLLKTPKFGSKLLHTFSSAFNNYIDEKQLRKTVLDSKGRKKNEARATIKRFQDFIDICGDQPITFDSIGDAQEQFKVKYIDNTPDSIRRRFVTMRSALRLYIKKHRLDVNIPDLNLQKHVAKTRKVFDKDAHAMLALHALGGDIDVIKCILLIMVQSNLTQSEVCSGLSFNLETLDSEVPYLPVNQGVLKTDYRSRPFVPILGVARLKQMLTELGDKLRSLDEISLNKRLNNRIRKITGSNDYTSYSFRHTWSSDAIESNMSSPMMNRLAGWSNSSKAMSQHYGRDGDYTVSRLKAYRSHQEDMFADLIKRIKEEGINY